MHLILECFGEQEKKRLWYNQAQNQVSFNKKYSKCILQEIDEWLLIIARFKNF